MGRFNLLLLMKKIPCRQLADRIIGFGKKYAQAIDANATGPSAIGYETSRFLRETFVYVGWPTRSRIGVRASQALLRLVCSVEHDHHLQTWCLELIRQCPAMDLGDADHYVMAYLARRVCRA